jgi:hypothetical protein
MPVRTLQWSGVKVAVASRMRVGASVVVVLVCASCGSEPDQPTCQTAPCVPDPGGTHSVDVGVPGGSDGLDFVPLEAGAELRLQTFGQGGTHVLLGVRTVGFGNRAFVGITLTNSLTGVAVDNPPSVRPQLFICDEQQTCHLVPILAAATGLTRPGEERNGLGVQVEVRVQDASGSEARVQRDAVLSTADL